MQTKTLLSLAAAAALASAQNTPTLAEALSSTPSLSLLNQVIGGFPELAATLGNATNITILAPNDEALNKALKNPSYVAMSSDSAYVQAFLSYHVVQGTIYSQNITETAAFAPTLLNNTRFSNVTGGQVVKVVKDGDDVEITSGLGSEAKVVTADVAITNGVVHIIDNFLTIPQNVSTTAIAAGLSSLAGALTAVNLVSTIDALADSTIFAPNNDAFADIASVLANLTTEQIVATLGYHVVNGTVAYSSSLTNGTKVTTYTGEEITITIDSDGDVYANAAKVVSADVLTAGGVVHVIDSVLNPANATVAPNTEEDDGVPAYSGAVSGPAPFTSGIPTPTGNWSLTQATGGAGGSGSGSGTSTTNSTVATSTGGASLNKAGMVGAAALFGGAVWVANL